MARVVKLLESWWVIWSLFSQDTIDAEILRMRKRF